MVRDLYYKPRGAQLYNVHFKDGRLANRVTERALCGLSPVDIDWVWDVEHRRRATPHEVRKLCKLSSER
jgi:hypothetical protein